MFTDIESSTQLHARLGAAYADLLMLHDTILERAIGAAGTIVTRLGDGVFAAFGSAQAAVEAAGEIQRAITRERWGDDVRVRVRIGLHSGDAAPRNGNYISLNVHLAARVGAAAFGGQVLATESVVEEAVLVEPSGWQRLGPYRLKDFEEPITLWQLTGEGLPPTVAETRATPAAARNIPDLRSSFVGRSLEMEQLTALLTGGGRLVTILGPGGIGKSRLAFEVTQRAASRFRDGAWLVLLANSRPGEVAADAVRQLRLPEQQGADPSDTLVSAWAERQALLVLDNCEHVVDDVAALVDRMLNRCAGVVVAATSREPLHLSGEREWRIPPLPVPVHADAISGTAVDLFVQRLESRSVGWSLTPADLLVAAEICQTLDGLPLAVELAAAQAATMPLPDLLVAIQRQPLLRSRDRSLEPRQRTADALIDWSYSLLDPQSQRLLRQLSVFRSGFSRSDAEAVAGLGIDTDATLMDLVDKSLIVRENDLEAPYRQLVIIREFARQRLAGDADERVVLRRHAEWAAAQAATLEGILQSAEASDADAAFFRAGRLLADIETAVAFAEGEGDGQLMHDILMPLARYLAFRVRKQFARWFERASELVDHPEVASRCAIVASRMRFALDDHEGAKALASRGLEMAKQAANVDAMESACLALGLVSAWTEQPREARQYLEPLLGSKNPRHRVDAAQGLGNLAHLNHDRRSAEEWYRRALADADGFPQKRAEVLTNIAIVTAELAEEDEDDDRLDEAEAMLRELLPQAEGLIFVGHLYLVLSDISARRGNSQDAIAWCTQGIQACQAVGNVAMVARLSAFLDELRDQGRV